MLIPYAVISNLTVFLTRFTYLVGSNNHYRETNNYKTEKNQFPLFVQLCFLEIHYYFQNTRTCNCKHEALASRIDCHSTNRITAYFYQSESACTSVRFIQCFAARVVVYRKLRVVNHLNFFGKFMKFEWNTTSTDIKLVKQLVCKSKSVRTRFSRVKSFWKARAFSQNLFVRHFGQADQLFWRAVLVCHQASSSLACSLFQPKNR